MMGSVNSTKKEAQKESVHNYKYQTQASNRLSDQKLIFVARAISTTPRLSHASQQASSRAYKPRRVLQARMAFSVFSPERKPAPLDVGDSSNQIVSVYVL